MKIYDLVKDTLENRPITRNSDKQLIWAIYSRMGLANWSDDTITKYSFLKAPSEESITRARRKIQERHPELRANESVSRRRVTKAQTKGTFIYREEA